MEDSIEQKLINRPSKGFQSAAEISRDFSSHMRIAGHSQEDVGEFHDSEVQEEDEEFSFVCGEPSMSPIAAGDVFANGQIRPAFPLFGRDSPFSVEGSVGLRDGLPLNPPVSKIFVETGGSTPLGPGSDEIVGPACEWSSRKAIEASPEAVQVCKKSNSTGFSKIWRFKEFVGIRCNSDGRDAFVFLNNGGQAAAAAQKAEPAGVKTKKEVKKGGKIAKTAQISAHEAYMKSKAKDEERRRSYLPYRPELVGFFTNVNGGLTKNVHPF